MMLSVKEIKAQSDVLIEILAPLKIEIEALKKQNSELIAAIELINNKESVSPDDLAEKAAKLVVVEKGADGKNGATIEELLPTIDIVVSDFTKKAIEEIKALVDSRVSEKTNELFQKIPMPKDGVDGKNGADGTSVSINDLMPHINKLMADLAAEIPKPKDGIDGQNGKDAADINILPDIDFSKSYPRGTWAAHNGGLYKSFAATSGERGWDCVVNGIASVDIERTGDREITVKIVDSKGTAINKKFETNDVIYRGIYDEKIDDSYCVGDMVTCGGSVWYCLTKNPSRPSDANRNWKLAVKKGRDGRDGRDGIDHTKTVSINGRQ